MLKSRHPITGGDGKERGHIGQLFEIACSHPKLKRIAETQGGTMTAKERLTSRRLTGGSRMMIAVEVTLSLGCAEKT